MALTHYCELIAMDFWQRLETLDNFCRTSYDAVEPALRDLERRRAEPVGRKLGAKAAQTQITAAVRRALPE